MRNLIFFLILGLLGYAGYSFWQDPDAFRQKVSGFFGGASKSEAPPAGTSDKPTGATGAPATAIPDSTTNVVREMVGFSNQYSDKILAPLRDSIPDGMLSALPDIKGRLNAEYAKAAAPATRARVQMAFQLETTIEQAMAQRADYEKKRKAAEYNPTPIPGAPKAKISPAEIAGKKKDAEFFIKSIEGKWDVLAAQYRTTINRLTQALRA